jgi:hypothetical protein
MKKLVSSIILGLALSVIPAAIYAACATVITTSTGYICELTSSSTTSTGVEICRYNCVKETQQQINQE